MAAYGWRVAFWVFGALSLLWLIPWSRITLPPLALRRSDADKTQYSDHLEAARAVGHGVGIVFEQLRLVLHAVLAAVLPGARARVLHGEMAQIAGAAYVINSVSAVATGWVLDRLVRNGRSANLVYKVTMGGTHLGAVSAWYAWAWETGRWPWAPCSFTKS